MEVPELYGTLNTVSAVKSCSSITQMELNNPAATEKQNHSHAKGINPQPSLKICTLLNWFSCSNKPATKRDCLRTSEPSYSVSVVVLYSFYGHPTIPFSFCNWFSSVFHNHFYSLSGELKGFRLELGREIKPSIRPGVSRIAFPRKPK